MMAKSRMPSGSPRNPNGTETLDKSNGKVPQIPDSHNSGSELEKLSEAAGGVSPGKMLDESNLFPFGIEKGGDEGKNSQGSDDVLFYPGDIIDTKSSKVSRPSPKVYRSLSLNADQGFKPLQKDYGNFERGSDVENLKFYLHDKKDTSARWTPEDVSTCNSTIQLGSTGSCEQTLQNHLEQTDDRFHQVLDEEGLATCTDIGIVGSAVSGSKENKLHSNYPLLQVAPNIGYRREYYCLKKRAKDSNTQRMKPRSESDCSFSHCFHPNQKHDWSSHNAKKLHVYNYAASKTGHIWARLRNTNLFEEAGTCSHIGEGYVLTCFHCIEKILFKDTWPNEQYLQQDLFVTFPKISDQKLHPGSTLVKYRFEPCLFSHSETEQLDYAVLRLDCSNVEPIPPYYSNYTNKTIDQERPVYIAGYQLHPKYPYGKFVTDSTALKLPVQALNLDFVESWSKMLENSFQAHIKKLHGMDPWKSTYYPVQKCGDFFPLLTSLIMGASGGFGLTIHPQDDLPVVNFMYRAGHPEFYYDSFFDSATPLCDNRLAIQNGFSPCWTFQEGVPIGAIVKEIRKSPFDSLNSIPFLLSDI